MSSAFNGNIDAHPIRIVSTVLHNIDLDSGSCEKKSVPTTNSDLEEFLADLLTEIQRKEQKRQYEFLRETTEFFTALKAFTETPNLEENELSEALAKRLMDAEEDAESRTGHLSRDNTGHINRGSFMQFLFRDGNHLSYLGVKMDYQPFLDEKSLTKSSGLSIKNKIYKACRVNFDADDKPSTVQVYDTNKKPAEYWWKAFLDLKETRTDSKNTRDALEKVLSVVSRYKKSHPKDYQELRNNVITYFKQPGTFKYDDFLDRVFTNYAASDQEFEKKLPKVIEKLNELPNRERGGFDTQFNLVPSEVKLRRTKYELSREISLSVEDGIKDIDDKVWSERTSKGQKLVVINSPEGFEQFTLKNREE